MQTHRQKAPRINYRKLRLDLLRANLESLLALCTKPSKSREKHWSSVSWNYRELTGHEALRVEDVFEGSFWGSAPSETELEKRERWLRLFVSLERAEEKLETGTEFYERFLAISPMKGLVLFYEPCRPGRGGQERQRRLLWEQIHLENPSLSEAQVHFTHETLHSHLFIAFTQEAFDAQAAA